MKKQTHLEKCLAAIKKHPMSELVCYDYDSHHTLRLSNTPMEGWILCTNKQAARLIPYAKETERLPTRGYKYHF